MNKPIAPDNSGTSGFLIATACLLLLLSFGYRAGFGLFVKPITEANGWGREIISIALAVQNLFWGVIAFFAGGLADRFGNVKVVIAGTFLYALGMVLMPGVTSPWGLNASAGILVGSGIAGTSFGIILPAMARAVGPRRQQWALGLGTAAGSIGQFAIVPLAQILIDAFGWATTLNILAGSALIMAVLAIPLAPFSGRQPAGQTSNAMAAALAKERNDKRERFNTPNHRCIFRAAEIPFSTLPQTFFIPFM